MSGLAAKALSGRAFKRAHGRRQAYQQSPLLPGSLRKPQAASRKQQTKLLKQHEAQIMCWAMHLMRH